MTYGGEPISYKMRDCANPGCRRQVTLRGFCCEPCERVSPAEPGSLRAGEHPMISHTAYCDELDDIASGRPLPEGRRL